MKDMTLGTFLRLVAATVVLTVITSVIMLVPQWQGLQASTAAPEIDRLLEVMIVLSSFVFAVVMVMMGYAIWKYRAKPGDESDGEPIHGNTRLEITWTLIPTIIVIFAAIYSVIVLSDIESEASADEPRMRVNVYSQQFAWRFDYPEANKTSTELHVPSGTQLELHLEALDVIHSFWVPEWRIKRDLVPGAVAAGDEGEGNQHIDNVVRVTPTVPGTYSVVCTELCGLGHATMRAPAITHPDQASFDEWLDDQRDIPDQVGAGPSGGRGAGSLE